MSAAITRQQQHVLDYMHVFFSMNDALPTCKNISRAFGYASPNAAGELVQRLAAHGLVEKNEDGGYRFCRGASTQASVTKALGRAARYLAGDDSIDSGEAESIAATLRALAARIPQS